ncbi:archaeosortase C [Methanolobus sp. ZRKC3]|uniref:archaeosortase C n=1 Tax=Methanolobus sp. ZRKC3 TaxID=3125786 RepID=UPI00324CDE02
MMQDNKTIIIILLILALFTGATIELAEGSSYVGVALLVIAAVLFTRIRLTKSVILKNSRLYIVLGLFIVFSDLLYNFITHSSLGTLDSMTFFLGISLIAFGINKPQLHSLGEFGAYISAVFIALFLIFYSMFGALKIDFLHLFDHYLVLMPTVAMIKILGIPVEIIATETVTLYGAEPMTIVIGGPCSGLYSMFLLVGIVAGYSRMEKMDFRKSLQLLGFAVLVAYIANLVRVLILYISAYLYGIDVMMMVHTHIGWMIFAFTAGIIMYIMNRK